MVLFFFFIIRDTDIASYTYDNTTYIVPDNIDDPIESLEEASTVLFQQFNNNLLKSILDSCQLLISSNENITVKIDEYEIENSERQN